MPYGPTPPPRLATTPRPDPGIPLLKSSSKRNKAIHDSYVYEHDISTLKNVCSDLIYQNRSQRSLCTCAPCLIVSRNNIAYGQAT